MKHTKDSPTPEVELTIFRVLKYLPSPYSSKSYYNNQFKDENSTKKCIKHILSINEIGIKHYIKLKIMPLNPKLFLLYLHTFFLNYKLFCTNIPSCSFTSETGTGLFFSKRILTGRSRNYLQNDQEGMLLPL